MGRKKDIKHCVACGISSTLNQYYWCIDCDKKFGDKSKYAFKCLACKAVYNLRDENTTTYSCSSCTKYVSFLEQTKRNTILAGKKVEVVDPIVDKDIMGLNEMKLYSDTKQVWWIRLIKWVLKYI